MQSRIEHNRINDVIESTIKNLSNLVDVNTVIGSPIQTDNDGLIIPISKVTIGVLAGGGEYGKLSIFNKASDLPYSAGNGAIVNVKPCGFLVKENSKYKLLSVSDTAYDKLFDKVSDFIVELNDEKNQ